MRKYLDIEILLIPLLFVLLLAFLASKRIGFLGGPLLALPIILIMFVPLFVRSFDHSRQHTRTRYILINIAATACICILIWTIRSAIVALLR